MLNAAAWGSAFLFAQMLYSLSKYSKTFSIWPRFSLCVSSKNVTDTHTHTYIICLWRFVQRFFFIVFLSCPRFCCCLIHFLVWFSEMVCSWYQIGSDDDVDEAAPLTKHWQNNRNVSEFLVENSSNHCNYWVSWYYIVYFYPTRTHSTLSRGWKKWEENTAASHYTKPSNLRSEIQAEKLSWTKWSFQRMSRS